MSEFLEAGLLFFLQNTPPAETVVTIGPLALFWGYCCLSFAGYLKQSKQLKTGYTRKVFHFLIFSSAVFLHWHGGLPLVCLFGGMVSLVIVYAVLRGKGHPLYEAMAREKDAPHQTYYIVLPYLTTLIGGMASNLFFGPNAIFGYLVTGFGDAIGEPIGTRYGKHFYQIPTLSPIPSIRSLEGSAAVGAVSCLALILGIALSPHLQFSLSSWYVIPLTGTLSMLVEAVSPHGWDNATMQIIPAYLMMILM